MNRLFTGLVVAGFSLVGCESQPAPIREPKPLLPLHVLTQHLPPQQGDIATPTAISRIALVRYYRQQVGEHAPFSTEEIPLGRVRSERRQFENGLVRNITYVEDVRGDTIGYYLDDTGEAGRYIKSSENLLALDQEFVERGTKANTFALGNVTLEEAIRRIFEVHNNDNRFNDDLRIEPVRGWQIEAARVSIGKPGRQIERIRMLIDQLDNQTHSARAFENLLEITDGPFDEWTRPTREKGTWSRWWEANRSYLYLNPASHRFEVDAEAKEAGESTDMYRRSNPWPWGASR